MFQPQSFSHFLSSFACAPSLPFPCLALPSLPFLPSFPLLPSFRPSVLPASLPAFLPSFFPSFLPSFSLSLSSAVPAFFSKSGSHFSDEMLASK
jgi:hypothetical protein